VLAYNEESHVFTGTVENVSDQVLKRVRVEVHLSNGSELGPATQLDLQTGEKRLILLEAGSGEFTTWSAHAEVESSEHGHKHTHGEGEHSHSPDGDSHGEHNHEGEGAHEHN
jgi:hypothetical protein